MRTKRDRQRAASIARKTMASGFKAHEMALAAAPVIAARAAIGAGALSQPSIGAVVEYNRMIGEKIAAMSMAGLEAAKSSSEIVMRAARFAGSEAMKLGTAPARSRSPIEFYNRLLTHNLAMGSLAMSAFGAALMPFHTAVRKNAKRLRRSSPVR